MRQTIIKMRLKIPRQNLQSYDATAESVLEELHAAPERYDERPGETLSQTVDRELIAAGFNPPWEMPEFLEPKRT